MRAAASIAQLVRACSCFLLGRAFELPWQRCFTLGDALPTATMMATRWRCETTRLAEEEGLNPACLHAPGTSSTHSGCPWRSTQARRSAEPSLVRSKSATQTRRARVHWAHGVVVSHPLCRRKALGSMPSLSMGCARPTRLISARSVAAPKRKRLRADLNRDRWIQCPEC